MALQLKVIFAFALMLGASSRECSSEHGQEQCVGDSGLDELAMLQVKLKVDKHQEIEKEHLEKGKSKSFAQLIRANKTKDTAFKTVHNRFSGSRSTAIECGTAADTAALYARLDTLSFTSGTDTVFPAGLDALGSSLSQYNTWDTMQSVATNAGSSFAVFGPNGPSADDVNQGSSGTCYFLAAVGSVARLYPEFIQSMFVDQGLWSSNIYTIMFFIMGKPTKIAVDNMLSVNSGGNANFAKPANGGFWVPIMQKAWAKLFYSYSNSEGNNVGSSVAEVYKSMSQAPTDTVSHDSSSSSAIWDLLTSATANNWPVSAGTGSSNSIGLANNHAYVVLRTVTDITGHPQALELYNPWSSDYYSGALASLNTDTSDGTFFCTLDEFFSSFIVTFVSEMKPGGVASVYTALYSPADPIQIQVTPANDFSLTIDYPSAAITGCGVSVSYYPGVSDTTLPDGASFYPPADNGNTYSNIRWDLEGGKTYQIYLTATFLVDGVETSRFPWFTVTAYGTEELNLGPICMDRLSKFGGTGYTGDLSECQDFVDNHFCLEDFNFDDTYYSNMYYRCQYSCGAPGRGCTYGMSIDSQCDTWAPTQQLGYIPIESSTSAECSSAAAYVKYPQTSTYTFCSTSYPGACHTYNGYLDYCSHVNAGVQKNKAFMICKQASAPLVQYVSSGTVTTAPPVTGTPAPVTTTTTTEAPPCEDTSSEYYDYYCPMWVTTWCTVADGSSSDRRRRRYAVDAYENCQKSCGICA